MTSSYDVRIWAIRVRKDRPAPYQVRWRVAAGLPFSKSFRTRALADSFRSELVAATRRGEAFDADSGMPASQARKRTETSWYDFAISYIDMKWPGAAGKSRISAVETLTAVTLLLIRPGQAPPDLDVLRSALRRWAFNPPGRASARPPEVVLALSWMRRTSLPVSSLQREATVQSVLNGLALKRDGTAASPAYLGRRRRVLYNVLKYAVRQHHLTENPLASTDWEPPDNAVEEINPRVVAAPEQVRELLTATTYVGARRGGRLTAFFACLYFGMLRPSEAAALRKDDCYLPATGWGRLTFGDTSPAPGRQWTDNGEAHEHRGLKNRPRNAVRVVPIPPEHVAILRDHIRAYGVARDGRLFRTETGGVLYPSGYSRVWQEARPLALPPAQAASLLARRPYDLRHGGISLRLNAGVPATQVAEWAGHSVEVLLTIYAKCIAGRDQVWFDRIDQWLGPQ